MEDLLVSIGFVTWVAAILIYREYASRVPKQVLDYQQGVKFRDGVFDTLLGPGIYRLHPQKEQLEIVDMRAHPFLFESLKCEDALHHFALVSVSGEIMVVDARKAVSNSRTQADAALARIPQVVRDAIEKCLLSDSEGSDSVALRASLENALTEQLSKIGVNVANLALNELWAAPIQSKVSAGRA